MSILGQNSAFSAILFMYVELEGHMVAQNDGLNEADKNFFFDFFCHFGHLELF